MAVADVNTAMAAAQSALASGDYATALDSAIAAQGYLAALADSEQGDSPRTSLRWDHWKIGQFVENIRARRRESQAATHGVQRSKITRARTSAS